MFSEVELTRDVVIWSNHLKGQLLTRQILHRLLLDLLHEKACREHGFYLGITALKRIGNNKHSSNNVFTFPVSFKCRTFLPARGDILQGTVSIVVSNGAFISSGPLRFAYLSSLKMPGYHFVPSQSEGEKPYFLKEDMSKIAVGVVVRFKVMAVRFKERPLHKGKRRNDLYVLATVDGDGSLGPISLTGADEPYM